MTKYEEWLPHTSLMIHFWPSSFWTGAKAREKSIFESFPKNFPLNFYELKTKTFSLLSAKPVENKTFITSLTSDCHGLNNRHNLLLNSTKNLKQPNFQSKNLSTKWTKKKNNLKWESNKTNNSFHSISYGDTKKIFWITVQSYTMTSPVGFIKITNVQKFGEHQHPQTNIIIIHKNTDVHKCIIILLSDNDKISPTIKWIKKKKTKQTKSHEKRWPD